MRETNITFSVVVTFFNQCEFVDDAIESILALDRSDLQIVAVDDASSDGTVDALREYEGKVKLVLLEENLGVSGARNAGAAVASGDYVLFFDDVPGVGAALTIQATHPLHLPANAAVEALRGTTVLRDISMV